MLSECDIFFVERVSKKMQRSRTDTVLAVALLPYVAYLLRRSMTVADAIEVALIALLEARLFLSLTNNLPMTPFENSFGGALTLVLTLVTINVLALTVPAMRREL